MSYEDFGLTLVVAGFALVTSSLGIKWLLEAYMDYQWDKLKLAVALDHYSMTGELLEDEEEEEEEEA